MMIDFNSIPDRSPLIDPNLEEQLRGILARIQKPITMVCICDAGDKSLEMASLLKHIAGIHPNLSLRLLSPGEDADADTALDASLLPAAGFQNEDGFARVAFHGVPGGKEMTGFVSALLAFAGAAKPLDKPTLRDIGRIKSSAHLRICVSLACQHCAKMVMNAQRIALENSLVSAHMIDANLYPKLVEQYAISRVPLLICDDKVLATGGMTMAELCSLLIKR